MLRYVLDPMLIHLTYSLDHIANTIASATFQVLNAGRVRTADMSGRSLVSFGESTHYILTTGSSTTSEFTAAVIKNLE
jgi:isocitrate dehydrogenase (NAD+)